MRFHSESNEEDVKLEHGRRVLQYNVAAEACDYSSDWRAEDQHQPRHTGCTDSFAAFVSTWTTVGRLE